jgi:hypothetical protein
MDFGERVLLKAWHMLQRPVGIEPGIRGLVRHAKTTVIDVAIKWADRNKHIARPMDLIQRRSTILLSNTLSPQAQNSGYVKTETGAEV